MKKGSQRGDTGLRRLDTETELQLENKNPSVNVVRALAGHNEE
jgi:hypothetical protein